jgi:hypothetical protein
MISFYTANASYVQLRLTFRLAPCRQELTASCDDHLLRPFSHFKAKDCAGVKASAKIVRGATPPISDAVAENPLFLNSKYLNLSNLIEAKTYGMGPGSRLLWRRPLNQNSHVEKQTTSLFPEGASSESPG